MGAGLARDAGTSVCQSDRGDAIAGKPAPTEQHCPFGHHQIQWPVPHREKTWLLIFSSRSATSRASPWTRPTRTKSTC
ncbi:hypothetical protein FEM54_05855 [Pseudomonas edaphica]|uniref:Uncharacterized protein n=1 Tax=Pseudomonas edaphica TaxID=2006980 RepID=A0ABY2U9S6_9PSED|nr:hypothetical protein FEM54_05855 [Pseudomonas edaphica]